MRTPRVALLVMLVMLLAPLSGCVGSEMPEWGKESGEITVKTDGDTVTIDSRLTEGGALHSMTATKTGCGNDSDAYVVEGWLSQFHHYPLSADEAGDDDDLLMGVTTVAIIELMSLFVAAIVLQKRLD